MKNIGLMLALVAAVSAAPLPETATKRDPLTVDQGFISLKNGNDWKIGEGGSKTHPPAKRAPLTVDAGFINPSGKPNGWKIGEGGTTSHPPPPKRDTMRKDPDNPFEDAREKAQTWVLAKRGEDSTSTDTGAEPVPFLKRNGATISANMVDEGAEPVPFLAKRADESASDETEDEQLPFLKTKRDDATVSADMGEEGEEQLPFLKAKRDGATVSADMGDEGEEQLPFLKAKREDAANSANLGDEVVPFLAKRANDAASTKIEGSIRVGRPRLPK